MADWWTNYPWRVIQTNFREIDTRDFDADRFIEALDSFSCNAVMLNAAGLIASYPTDLTDQPLAAVRLAELTTEDARETREALSALRDVAPSGYRPEASGALLYNSVPLAVGEALCAHSPPVVFLLGLRPRPPTTPLGEGIKNKIIARCFFGVYAALRQHDFGV